MQRINLWHEQEILRPNSPLVNLSAIALAYSLWMLLGIADARSQETTKKLSIHPKAAVEPSLNIRLVPDTTEQLEGNAAIHYLKAVGFLEQDFARDRIRSLIKKASEAAEATGKQQQDYPPFLYLDLLPKDYPKQEVREYLQLIDFQVPSLREARRLRDFNMHRNIHLSDNPIGYLLPDMQAMRELARNQRVRCRLAIAEDRMADAIEVIGQQVSLSRHISMDDFLICYLVGTAILNIGLDDTMLAIEHPECPNLYWAFAQLPDPLLSTDRCIAFERQFLYLQIPRLREIDATQKPPEFWKEFLSDFAKRTSDFDKYNDQTEIAIVSKVQGEQREASISKQIEENHPQAKAYLLSRGILKTENIQEYTKEHAVFLAMKDYYEVMRDEQFKWLNLPYSVASTRLSRSSDQIEKDKEKWGWFTWLPSQFLPAVNSFYTTVNQSRQRIAVIQAIEAIRMAGAINGGKLIESLDEAPVPVPVDPFTGKAFSYQVAGDTAIITSNYPEKSPLRIEVQFSK